MNPIVPKRVYVKPGAGLKVRNPETGLHVPEEGAWLLDDKYLRRRMNSGDLVPATPPRKTKPAPVATNEEK